MHLPIVAATELQGKFSRKNRLKIEMNAERVSSAAAPRWPTPFFPTAKKSPGIDSVGKRPKEYTETALEEYSDDRRVILSKRSKLWRTPDGVVAEHAGTKKTVHVANVGSIGR